MQDTDPRFGVDLGGQQLRGVEPLEGQRPEPRGLEFERLTNAQRPPFDVTQVVTCHPLHDQFVDLGQTRDVGDRDQMPAAEPADLALHPALLMGAFDAGLAEERIEPNR
jgi:hypothetical protein